MNKKTTPDKPSLTTGNKAPVTSEEIFKIWDHSFTRTDLKALRDNQPNVLIQLWADKKEVDDFIAWKWKNTIKQNPKKEAEKNQPSVPHLWSQESVLTHKKGISGRVNGVFASLANWSGLEVSELKVATVVLSTTTALMVWWVVFLTQTKIGKALTSSEDTTQKVKVTSKKIRTKEPEVTEKKVVQKEDTPQESEVEAIPESHPSRPSIAQTTEIPPAQNNTEKVSEKPAVVRTSRNRADINAQAFMKNPEALLSEIWDYNAQQQGKSR